jgi:protein-S-isoprenylcysteine O-methyltransferase Ste14
MDFHWANLDIIRSILTVSTSIPFLLFASAGIWHFGGGHQSGTWLVSTSSVLGFILAIYAIWSIDNIHAWAVLGVALQSASLFLFGWSIGTSGKRNLGLALNDNSSKRLITEGPYKWVRHPFYTSYILFWVANIAIASSLFTLFPAIFLISIYLHASRSEDRVLAKLFADEYPTWHKRTGAFFPKWHWIV